MGPLTTLGFATALFAGLNIPPTVTGVFYALWLVDMLLASLATGSGPGARA